MSLGSSVWGRLSCGGRPPGCFLPVGWDICMHTSSKYYAARGFTNKTKELLVKFGCWEVYWDVHFVFAVYSGPES